MNLSIKEIKSWQRFIGVSADGAFGPATTEATKRFQRKHSLVPDGDPGTSTLIIAAHYGFDPHAATVAATDDALIATVLPAEGIGYATYNREAGGADQFGTSATIAAIERLGKEWSKIHSEVAIQIGDISRQGGGAFPPHAGHRRGTEFDMRPIRRDNKLLPVEVSLAIYDSARTEEFVRLVKGLYPRAGVLFNDRRLINLGLTRHAAGHHNHLHVRLG